MKLNTNDLYFLSQTAISAAYQAGHLISKYYKKKLSVKKKNTGESQASQVVTEIDIMSQEIILNNIKPACNIYDLALLTEETPDDRSRLQKDYFWSIDPLDGTLPFIESRPGFSVSIALVSRSGTPLIGVIYDPLKKILYHAVKSQGAYINGNPWMKNRNISKNELTVYIDKDILQFKHYNESINQIKSKFNNIKIVKPGGAVMSACWVLDNAPACFFKFPRIKSSGGSLWDYSASTCLFNETGGYVSDIYGNPLDLNRIDSTFMNHRGFLYASDKELAEKIIKLLSKIEV